MVGLLQFVSLARRAPKVQHWQGGTEHLLKSSRVGLDANTAYTGSSTALCETSCLLPEWLRTVWTYILLGLTRL